MSAAPKRSAPLPPPPADEHEEEEDGASANERLLAAAKNDNESLLESALEKLKDINGVDGLGNTALHYAILHASTNVLETILCHETCDVDLRNRLAGDTPLHIAVRQRWEEAPGLRRYLGRRGLERSMLIVVESLLEAGADTKIRNRHNQKPIDLLPPYHPSSDAESDDEQVRSALRRAEAEAMVADAGDVANDSDGEVDPDDIASD